ncbi:hypothetical protein B0H13DRAFT_2281228 [Mycena leptocephala]|nr:hypothetical protein B0H13DRAFT_2281228 [Mycena leptocephala]
MSADGTRNSKHTADEQLFINRVSARRLMDFCTHMYTPGFLVSNSSRFLDHEWVDLPALKYFLETPATYDPNAASTRTDLSAADRCLLDTISVRELTAFRNHVHTPHFIVSHAPRFLDHRWIDVTLLREFLKIEANPPLVPPPTALSVKLEVGLIAIPPSHAPIKTRTLNAGGHEIIELLSDSESDGAESDLEVTDVLMHGSSRSSSPVSQQFLGEIGSDDETAISSGPFQPCSDDGHSDDDESLPAEKFPLVESDTHWEDGATSMMRIGSFRITRKVKVERIEYVTGAPSILPIFRTPTAIVIDLSDPDYAIIDPKTGKVWALYGVVRDIDNDSWKNEGSGGGASKAQVLFVPGEPLIQCRRSGSTCRGAFACEKINPALRTAERFELDPASRRVILEAQAATRWRDGTMPEHNVAIFMKVIMTAKCKAIDSNGNKCQGAPILRAKPQVFSSFNPHITSLNANQGPSRGHHYFVGCSGCVPGFSKGHQSHSIPDNCGEQMVAKSLANQPLSDDSEKDTEPCSKLVHPNIGLRQHFCPHVHIVDGKAVRSRIEQTPCFAKRNIYVPLDTSIRKVIIVTNGTGHNHPMPPLAKQTLGGREIWKKCVTASGIVGATAAKVENAPSTPLILGGKMALQSKRVKRDIIRGMKSEQFPLGLDETGLFHIYLNNLTKPLPERYIHGYITTDGGGIGVVTFVPYLLKLLDDPGVISFDGDTTYKRINGRMNEWELTIFVKIALRSASVVRAYINRGSTDFFELLFDELQRVKLIVTGRPIPLERFVKGGNIRVMNSDMDGAQVLGICRSVMKHNDPEYSGIPNDTPPEQVAWEFVKICWRHAKEPVHDFRSLVSEADHARLRDFAYIDSKEKLDEFSAFIVGLGVKKIQGRSQSHIPNDIWDTTPSTTNTNEAQHAWTNSLAGIGLSLVEAVETACQLDHKVADEIELTLRTGIFSNPNNEQSHRVARSSTRQSTRARHARESDELTDATKEISDKLEMELEKRRESNATSKDLREQLQVMKGKGGGSRRDNSSSLLAASSSGRVKSAPAKVTSRKRSAQSNDIPPPTTTDARSPPPMFSANLPGVGTTLVDQPATALVPELSLPQQVTQPMGFLSTNVAFDFGTLDPNAARSNADFAGGGQQFPGNFEFDPVGCKKDPAQAECLPVNCRAPVQGKGEERRIEHPYYDFAFFNAPVTAVDSDPLQSLIDSFGTHGTPLADSLWLSSTPNVDNSSHSPFAFPTHPGNEELPSFSVPIAVGVDTWPTLPPPQLDLPSSPPMTNVSSAATAKARSHREPEVDVRNILPETSARSRVPAARKRNAEETIGVRKAAKKSKKLRREHGVAVQEGSILN